MRAVLTPTHIAVVWDGGLAVERMEELPAYKQNRPPMPDSLDRQISDLEGWLGASRLASLVQEGVEADDWIAGLAQAAAGAGAHVIIASSDKDFMQLVTPQIGLFNPNDKSEKVWRASDVQAKTGVTPEQIVDWLSLIGDGVDNIAGVAGVGEKTATDLLRHFGSVEAMLARLNEVKSERLRASLREAEAAVRRNQRLIRLRVDAGRAVPWEELQAGEPERERLRSLYAEWGFKRLLAELGPAAQQTALF